MRTNLDVISTPILQLFATICKAQEPMNDGIHVAHPIAHTPFAHKAAHAPKSDGPETFEVRLLLSAAKIYLCFLPFLFFFLFFSFLSFLPFLFFLPALSLSPFLPLTGLTSALAAEFVSLSVSVEASATGCALDDAETISCAEAMIALALGDPTPRISAIRCGVAAATALTVNLFSAKIADSLGPIPLISVSLACFMMDFP